MLESYNINIWGAVEIYDIMIMDAAGELEILKGNWTCTSKRYWLAVHPAMC